MAKIARWIGGVLGWTLGGPIGGLMGFVFGEFVDSITKGEKDSKSGDYKQQYKKYRHHTTSSDFENSLLILSAAVMKADGVSLKSELTYINSFYIENYGEDKAKHYMAALQKLLDNEFDLRRVCEQIRYFMEHSLRLQILHYLFGIAKSDGYIHPEEIAVIFDISRYLGIHRRDFESVKAMFYAYSSNSRSDRTHKSYSKRPSSSSLQNPYVILEIPKTATDQEVKKAYRSLARKYHPDKVAHMGDKYVEKAKEKFIIVDEAYDSIKRQRGMK